MKIIVIGAGAWGTALAMNASARHAVTLWARDAAQARAMQAQGCNARYLPDMALPPALRLAGGDAAALQAEAGAHDLVIIATPMAGLREHLALLRDVAAPVVWLCKGFEKGVEPATGPGGVPALGLLGHEICAQVAPERGAGPGFGVLSGPSFALEVARGQPTALVAASRSARVRDTLVEAFHGPALRVYANDDVVGVEVGGAVKNVLAIATGVLDGLAERAAAPGQPPASAPGLNARAALITRGLAEMTRLGLALGARADTFMGLSGLGDLVLTATGSLSRNRKVGLLLAQGLGLAEAVASLGHVAEGVYCARSVWQRAQALGVDMPITAAVVALLDGQCQPAEAAARLMGRGPAAEAPGA